MSNYTEEIKIKSYNDLVQIIHGKTDQCNDLRDKFIFRGIENEKFLLIPSALRENSNINDFVDEKLIEIDEENDIFYAHYIQQQKEINVLMKFFDEADKVGLKIPISQDIRKLLHHNKHGRQFILWPDPDYFELISLAQHYGVPTRALDWSYDYKVALYFAVKNILNNNYTCNNKPVNGTLWAFNYKLFETDYECEDIIYEISNPTKKFGFKCYRPEYNSNPNLNAQKGLFTFVMSDNKDIYEQPFNEIIEFILSITDNFGYKRFRIQKGEKAFYKFKIPENIKPEILNELYLEGYSEKYLFPGYSGVVKSIKNKVKLNRLCRNPL